MAAYAALVSLMNDLELIQKHPRHSFSFEDKQIASLSQTVHFLIDFMEIYDSHGCSREAVQVLESRIASAAHAAHDVVESHVVDQIHAGTTLDGKARSHFLPDLQKAIDDMGFVKREAMLFEARCGIKAEQITYSPPTSSKPLTSGKNCMVGFDAVLVRLMEMLTGEDSSRLVIPIEGMGGMGKTTLAKNAYDRLLIQRHFDVLWPRILEPMTFVVARHHSTTRPSPPGPLMFVVGPQYLKHIVQRVFLWNLSVELRLLRVSDRVEAGICSPKADIQRVNLRYFGSTYIRVSEIYSLPWSISLCWNLQTISMSYSFKQITAPQEIWEMAQLRHLEFNELCLPDPLPGDQQECIILRNLQTLVGVKNLKLTEEVCERMPNIKELYILYDLEACSDCFPGNLGGFNKLESLNLCRCDSVQSFTFPSSLQELCLESRGVDWEDIGMIMKSLPHLGILELTEVKGEEWGLADEEEFLCLKYLRISYCPDLIYWDANSSNFPVLETLEIGSLPKLSEIPIDMGDIPTLAHIDVINCSVSAAVSAMRIVVEQQSCGNEDLQLDVEFNNLDEVERFQKLVQEDDLITNSLRLSCSGQKVKAF